MIAVQARDVHKSYGATRALAGLDLEVPRGSVYGVLGPNGAGKTTAVRVFATLTRPDRGEVRVDGIDVVRQPQLARTRIGLAGQLAAVDEKLTGRENLRMFGRLSHLGERRARQRAEELLDQFALTGAANRLVSGYSGGMRRRLDLSASLLVSPAVLFLDEPTTGLDPRARGEVWSAVRDLADRGTTVLLTTQYLDEADHLAAQIAVIDAGRVIAAGTPESLKRMIGGDRVEIVVEHAGAIDAAAAAVAAATGTTPQIDREARRVSAVAVDPTRVLIETVRALDQHHVVTEDIAVRRPTLDDVFLALTGHTSTDDQLIGANR
jgi:ABC-2 type transport system ATP-binding protein